MNLHHPIPGLVGGALLIFFLVIVQALAGAYGGGLKHDRRIADERFPDHCAPITIAREPVEMGSFAAWANPTECRIEFSPGFAHYASHRRCSILVHEYGHLAGRDHTNRRHSIMYPGHGAHRMKTFGPCR